MAILDSELVSALNTLLEDMRASVEVTVALAGGAADIPEREAIETMGYAEVGACCDLREYLSDAGAPVTPRINGIALELVRVDRYDERLHAFARHQASIAAQSAALLPAAMDDDLRALMQGIHDDHVRATLWCERRATAFSGARQVDVPVNARGPDSATDGEAGADAESDGSGAGADAVIVPDASRQARRGANGDDTREETQKRGSSARSSEPDDDEAPR